MKPPRRCFASPAGSRSRGTTRARGRSSTTTSRTTLPTRRCPEAADSRTRQAASRGRSPVGPTYRPGSSCVATTASFRLHGCAGSFATASGSTPDEIDSGHCPALSRPVELARPARGLCVEHRRDGKLTDGGTVVGVRLRASRTIRGQHRCRPSKGIRCANRAVVSDLSPIHGRELASAVRRSRRGLSRVSDSVAVTER